ncbi:MAG TPA: lactate racemase domain-containing protein [Chloroflexota bacterium]
MHLKLDVPEDVLSQLLDPVSIPPLARVRQHIETPPALRDVEAAVGDAIKQSWAESMLRPGDSVAIGVGSRGIGRLPEIVSAVVRELRARGAEPFIVPAMGSHGGATAEGQRAALEHLGVTEESVGAPIRSQMRTDVIARTPSGAQVHMDSLALRADGIIFIARIKPHTAFRGPYESGLAKMIAIGLGKQAGAAATHALGFGEMARAVPEMAREALRAAPVRFGLAVLENAFDLPYKIQAIPADRMLAEEPVLLEEARAAMPRIPFDELDVLIIDRIGKNISGDGADPNITGRYPTPYASGGPAVNKQVVLDLTDASAGNANGVGTADFTTLRLARKMSLAATYPNALTSTVPRPVAIPMVLPSDRYAIAAAILTCNAVVDPPRIVRIVDTLHLEEFWVSSSLLTTAEGRRPLELVEAPAQLPLDAEGNISDVADGASPQEVGAASNTDSW